MARFNGVGAFILAGGESSRMGRDKALLEIQGMPMIVRIARLLEEVAGAPIVIGPAHRYGVLGLQAVEDDRAGLGPLGGVVTALGAAQYDWSLVVGCDMPFLSADFLGHLVRRALGSKQVAVLPQRERGLEPLCAMYARKARVRLLDALDRGERKLTDAAAKLAPEIISPHEWKSFDTSGLLFENVNTPADYQAALARIKQ